MTDKQKLLMGALLRRRFKNVFTSKRMITALHQHEKAAFDTDKAAMLKGVGAVLGDLCRLGYLTSAGKNLQNGLAQYRYTKKLSWHDTPKEVEPVCAQCTHLTQENTILRRMLQNELRR